MPAPESPSRGFVRALVAGIAALALLACAGGVILAGGGAAAVLFTTPSGPVQIGGPVGIRATATRDKRTSSPTRTSGLFVYVDVEPVSEAAPARFRAPLPSTIDELYEMTDGASRFPPYSHVAGLACAGDPAMGSQIVASMRAALKAGATPADVKSAYEPLFLYCDPMPCAFLRFVVTGNESAAVKAPFWDALTVCRDDETAKVFERPDAPDGPWLARLSAEPPQPWSKRLESAAASRIRNGAAWEAQTAAMVLGAADDPRIAKALLAIHAAETEVDKRKIVALAMYRQSDPAARTLFEKTCDETREEQHAVCVRTPEQNAAPPSRATLFATKPIGELLDDYGIDQNDVVEANATLRRPELLAALERCASASSEWRGRRCLSALAVLDWKSASRIAIRMGLPEDDGALEMRQALRLFDDRPSFLAQLRHDGLLRAGDTVDPRIADPRGLLLAAGRAYDMDGQSTSYPNQHDALLGRLARLARPELDGIVFLETPPPVDEESGETDGSSYRVDAWLGGKRWSVEMDDLGDSYDLDRCLGLLNAILEDRGSAVRFATLASGDQGLVVIAGSGAGIEKLARDRLLVTASPGDSATDGSAFEEQALDAARRSGGGGR